MERNEGDHFDKPSDADYTGHSEKKSALATEQGVGEGTSKKQTRVPVPILITQATKSSKKKIVTVFEAKEE